MAVIKIPTSKTLSVYTMSISLDEKLFNLNFRYNSREEAWYMDLFDSNFTPIRQGTALRTGTFPWLRTWTNDAPDGLALVLDPSGKDLEPGRNTLGTDVLLVYNDILELTASL